MNVYRVSPNQAACLAISLIKKSLVSGLGTTEGTDRGDEMEGEKSDIKELDNPESKGGGKEEETS